MLTNFSNNNSEVFFINNAAIWALATLMKQKIFLEKTVIVICPTFWLDRTHPKHESLAWGMTPTALPPLAKQIFSELYPNYNPQKKITWGHYKSIRSHVMNFLKQQNNVYFFAEIAQVTPHREGFLINVAADNPTQLLVSRETTFNYWYRQARKNQLGLGEPVPVYTLYYQSKTQYDRLCILGAGLTTAWVVRDFDATIVSIHLPKDKQIKIPSNEYINTSRLFRVPIDKEKMHPLANNTIYYYPTNHSHLPLNMTCQFYDAIGLEAVIAPSILRPYLNWDLANASSCDWVAPQNIPYGSTIQSYTVLANQHQLQTELLPLTPGMYCDNYFRNYFSRQMRTNHCDISASFFVDLKQEIQSFDDVPTEPILIDLYLNIYNNTNQKPENYLLFLKIISQSLSTLPEHNNNCASKFTYESDSFYRQTLEYSNTSFIIAMLFIAMLARTFTVRGWRSTSSPAERSKFNFFRGPNGELDDKHSQNLTSSPP